MTIPSNYLDFYLEPLQVDLQDPSVTDIYLNGRGELWVEHQGGETHCRQLTHWDESHSWRLARQISQQSSQAISRAHPLVSAALPDGTRVQIIAPPASLQGVVMAFRRHTTITPPLDSYRLMPRASDRAQPLELQPFLDNPGQGLRQAVLDRRNIVISGGTSSGKTTLLNSLMAEIPLEERLISIEDAPELQMIHPNGVRLQAVKGEQGEASVTTLDLLEASLRMRPSRILLGELRGAEAFTFLRAINTGHPGSITTIHADSPERALSQLALMTQQARLGLSYPDALLLVREMVDLVVQVRRVDGHYVLDGPPWMERHPQA